MNAVAQKHFRVAAENLRRLFAEEPSCWTISAEGWSLLSGQEWTYWRLSRDLAQ